MEALLALYVSMAASVLDVNVPPEVPLIEFATEEQLLAIGMGNVGGAYEIATHVVYLPKDWDVTDIHDQSALYHEVFHYVQFEAEIPYNVLCKKHVERQAWEAQEVFLNTMGRSIFAEKDEAGFINRLAYMFITNCMPDEPGVFGPYIREIESNK